MRKQWSSEIKNENREKNQIKSRKYYQKQWNINKRKRQIGIYICSLTFPATNELENMDNLDIAEEQTEEKIGELIVAAFVEQKQILEFLLGNINSYMRQHNYSLFHLKVFVVCLKNTDSLHYFVAMGRCYHLRCHSPLVSLGNWY